MSCVSSYPHQTQLQLRNGRGNLMAKQSNHGICEMSKVKDHQTVKLSLEIWVTIRFMKGDVWLYRKTQNGEKPWNLFLSVHLVDNIIISSDSSELSGGGFTGSCGALML